MPNPPSREQARPYIWRCPECGEYAPVLLQTHEGRTGHWRGSVFCASTLERIEVVPAADLAALQSDLRIARELGDALADAAIAYVANPSPVTGQLLGVHIAKWRAQQLEAGQKQEG